MIINKGADWYAKLGTEGSKGTMIFSLLGNIAMCSDKRLMWDGPAMRFTNDESANKRLARAYRDDWKL